MINHKHKFLFIHIPRTGGTSIEEQFEYREEREKNKHWNLSDWVSFLGNEKLSGYFKFTFVRNPWDIVASNYCSVWYNNPKLGGEIGLSSGKSLDYFLSKYKPAPFAHGDSFFDYITPNQMDFIGRYETREKDLKFISDKISFDINSKVRARINKNKHYTEYYDDETRQIVAEKYAKDIEYFGYKFGE